MQKDEEDPKIKEEDSIARRTVSRREFLKYAGVAGAAVGFGGGLGGLLAACGGEEETTTTAGGGETTTTAGGGETTTSMAESTTTVATGIEPPAQDTIRIGASRSISGGLSFFEENAFGPLYKLWTEEVNSAGGIDVAGKKLPVEMVVYDDQSNLDTCTRLLEKLMVEDKVDFVFSPVSTAFFFAAAGVANAHGYLMFSAEGGATSIREILPDLPLFFGLLNFSDWYQMPVLVEIFQEVGVQSVAMLYLEDLHGLEYSDVMKAEMEKVDIALAYETSIPPDIKDFSPILRQVQEKNPDCLFVPCYPDQNFPLVGQMIQLGYSPPMLAMGPGITFSAFPYAMGGEAGPETGYKVAEGVVGYGAWSINSSPALSDFHDKLLTAPLLVDMGFTEANMDYWGHAFYQAGLEMFQASIEAAGTLDNTKVAEVMKTQHLDTLLGDTWYDNQLLAVECHPGEVGQWQSSIFEVIDTGAKRTAPPIYPKPAWPTA